MAEQVHIGLSSWIVQDGNYADFRVGQEASFALEFYAPDGLRAATGGPPTARWVSASRYHVRARVVFAPSNVWVVDTGTFASFREAQPPVQARVGSLVEGEVYLGIDPFFYSDYLHRTPGMPALTYRWVVRNIQRETTPWVIRSDAQGRPYRIRDAGRETHVAVQETDAWHDDNGDGDYVLTCERLGGPDLT